MKANRSQVASIFGVALTTVDGWVKSGCPVEKQGKRGVSSVYDTAEVLKWLQSADCKTTDELQRSIDEEKLRKIKRENDIAARQLAPVTLLSDALQKVGLQMVALLEALPLEMKRANPKLTGHDIMMVKKSIHKCCDAISRIQLADE